jgi:hypothetical protein
MMPPVLKDIFVNLATKFIMHLIGIVATKAGADDLIFMLIGRIQRGGKRLLSSVLALLGAAIVDRLLWLQAFVDEFDAGAFLLVERRGVEMSLFYVSATMVVGFFDLKYVEHLVDLVILPTPISLVAPMVAVLIVFLLAAYVLAVVTRYMMEMRELPRWPFLNAAERSMVLLRRGAAFVSCAAAIGCVFTLVLQAGRAHALQEASAICGVALVVAYVSSLLHERFGEKHRTDRVRSWGPAGRPFGRRDLVFRGHKITR